MSLSDTLALLLAGIVIGMVIGWRVARDVLEATIGVSVLVLIALTAIGHVRFVP